jgi:hypothetical protein
MLIFHIHRPAQHHESLIPVHIRLRIGIALEIVEADAVAARADARVQGAERLGGNMLEDHQARHGYPKIVSRAGVVSYILRRDAPQTPARLAAHFV